VKSDVDGYREHAIRWLRELELAQFECDYCAQSRAKIQLDAAIAKFEAARDDEVRTTVYADSWGKP
jgi:lipopolysaccharide biosynthesis regulator YciM